MLSHTNLVTSAMGCTATGEFVSAGGTYLHAAPMFHAADQAGGFGGALVGVTHVIVPGFDPKVVLDAIAVHKVTDALLVPTMIQVLVDHPDIAAVRPHQLPQPRVRRLGHRPGRARAHQEEPPERRLMQAYGMTELSPVTTLLRFADHEGDRIRSAGRAAPHSEVRILDADDNEVPRGTVGEICSRGGHVMLGYWNKPEETAAAIRNGWMHSGDGGYMDVDGFVYVVDRIKDMIVTGGENVYSAEVEQAVALHPAVAACAIIGIPDPEWGERVHAVVVLAPGATVTPEELREHCKGHIAGYKAPRSAEFIDALPVNGAGKVLKRDLRAPYWEGSRPRRRLTAASVGEDAVEHRVDRPLHVGGVGGLVPEQLAVERARPR